MNSITRRIRQLSIGLLLLLPTWGWAAPVDGVFTYHQPDGSTLSVKVVGDEFFAEETTVDGRHIIQDPISNFWCYARLSDDGTALESTGVVPAKNGPHGLTVESLPSELRLKIPKDHRLRIDRANRACLGRDPRGRLLREGHLDALLPAEGGGDSNISLPVVGGTTLGAKRGLTLLIRFSDQAADVTTSRAQVDNFCNLTSSHYTEFGNNGSISEFFSDVSSGKLSYTNNVADYYTAKQPRTYYTDESIGYGTRASELIKEALNSLEASGFDFRTVDADSDGVIDALNCFYAGSTVNAWAKGLWPHASSLSWRSVKTGVNAGAYQITNMGQTLAIGTFCHENGHMLCDFPDVYDYGYDSAGGGGKFCLMNSGGHGTNPCAPNAYLRYKAGWGTMETILPQSSGLKTLIAEENGRLLNQFLAYFNPTNSKEYFILENRYKNDRDSGLPTGGIAVWHVDEQGNHDNQSYAHQASHANYEVALVQADNQRDFERNVNSGDVKDLFYAGNPTAGYLNEFTDVSDGGTYDNNAHWWNGAVSGLKLSGFSGQGNSMSLIIQNAVGSYTITASASAGGSISPSGSVSVAPGSNAVFTIQPSAGYTLNTVTVDSVNKGAITSYTFSNVQAAHVISATFQLDSTSPTGVPTPPTGSVVAATPDSPAFTWGIGTAADPESGITGYQLQVGTTPGGSDVFDGVVGNVLTKSLLHLGADGQTYYARVRAMNGSGLGTAWSGVSAGLSISYPVFTCSAVDNCGLTFKTIGPWSEQSAIKYFGASAARSAAMGDNASTLLQTTVTGPGSLSFYWKVSCEKPQSATEFYDNLAVSIDGVIKKQIAGELDWMLETYSIPPGSHVIRWTYTKDPAVAEGSDAGWVDKVDYVSTMALGCDHGSPGAILVLTGTQFTGASAVKFNGVAANSFAVNSATQITVTVPVGATTGPVTVITPGGSVSSTRPFSVLGFDLNHDTSVDLADLARLTRHFGALSTDPGFSNEWDLNGDLVIDEQDVLLFFNGL